MVNSLCALSLVSHITQLPAACPETVSKRAFFNTHRPERLMPVDGKRLQGLKRTFHRLMSRALDGVTQLLP